MSVSYKKRCLSTIGYHKTCLIKRHIKNNSFILFPVVDTKGFRWDTIPTDSKTEKEREMSNYIITERADRNNSIKVRVSTGISRAKGGCNRKLACTTSRQIEQRLNELAGTYAVVMAFSSDEEAKTYAARKQAALAS